MSANEQANPIKKLDVPLIRQRPELPTGCEGVALTMALHYYGINVDKQTIVDQMPLDTTPDTRNGDGSIKTWGDPENGFVGDPRGDGITINPNPLKQVLDQYRSGGIALYGKDFSIIQNYVASGTPVLVWFTISHEMPILRYWHTPAGKEVFAPRPLHCIVVTGFDEHNVYFNDCESTKLSGKDVLVEKNKFVKIYDAMGRRALVVE